MRIWTVALLLVVGMTGGACVVPPSGGGGTPPPELGEYRLAPPDQLQIIVRGVDLEINRQVGVRPDGRISFDLVGDIEVLGKTMPEVRTELQRRLQEFIRTPDVTVILGASNSRRYYVFGEVNRVGAFALDGEVTAVEALAAAGGPTIFANVNSSWLARPSDENPRTYRIYYDRIMQRSDSTTNYTLQPGDVIYVPAGFSAQLGNALRVIFYPIQQIIGLGGNLVRSGSGP